MKHEPAQPETTQCPDGGCGKYPNCPCGESYRETPPEVPRTTHSDDYVNRADYLRQIADELDADAVSAPCSEAEIIRQAATEIEFLRAELEAAKADIAMLIEKETQSVQD